MITDAGYAVAYTGVGLALLLLGFLVLDLLTPGNLARQIFTDRSLNAAIILGAGFLGLGLVVFAAIWTNATNGFGTNLEATVLFGAVGVLLQAVAVVVLDLLTPGSLREIIVSDRFHPATVVSACAQLAISVIVVAAIW